MMKMSWGKLKKGAVTAFGFAALMVAASMSTSEARAETYTFKASQSFQASREFGDYYKSAYLKCTLYKNQNQVDHLITRSSPEFIFRKLHNNNYSSRLHSPTTLVINTTQPAKSYWCRMVGVIRSNNHHQDLPGVPLLGASSFVEKKGNF